jgi:hypothetical protein
MKVLSSLISFLLISFLSVSHPYIVFEENGKVGLKNQDGKVLIPAQYEAIGWSNNEFSVLNNVTGYRTGSGWGLIGLNNQKITKHEYTSLIPAEGGLIVAGKKLNPFPKVVMGCINFAGKQIIPFLYDGISISSLRAVVFTKIGNQFKYGLIDLQNKTLIPQQYQEIESIGTLRYAVRNFEGKIALFSDAGERISEFVIDSLSAFKNNFAVIYQGKFKGVIQRDGQIRLEPKYREIKISENNKINVREADEWLFLDEQNKLIKKTNADSVIVLGDNLLKLVTDKQTQLVDRTLSPIGNSILTQIFKFKNGRAVYKLGELYGVLMKDGRVVVPAMYHQIKCEKDYIFGFQKKEASHGWIFFDSAGIRKMNRVYEALNPLGSEYFAVKHKGYWGVINLNGKEVVACAYDSLLQLNENAISVKFKGLYGIITTSEEWIVAPKPNKIILLNNKRYIEFTPSSTFLKEWNGNVIYFTTNRVEAFPEYFLEFLPSGNVWRIDLNGLIIDREVLPDEPIQKIFEVSEGYRAIKRNGRYGFIDSQGRLRIANRYEDVQPFQEGHAAVKILGKWGFINLQDNIAVQPVYEEVKPFQNGFALVKQKGFFGLIDTKGRLILPLRFQNITILASKNFLIEQNGQKGLADHFGHIIIQPRFDDLSDLGNGFVIVSRNQTYGVVAYNGLSIVPLIYDFISFDPFLKQFLALKKAPWHELIL